MADCPTERRLADYAAGHLAGADAEALAGHLGACEACRRRAGQLREDERLAARLREATGLGGKEALRQKLQARVAGDYEVLGVLGEGAGGVVFKARDVHLDRFVAIKCPADGAQRGRLAGLFDEARILATINHPNVAAVYALAEHPDLPLIVMEYVEGSPVTEAVAGAPLEQRLAVFRQVLRGATELHRRGIVHRDLKPANILVDRSGAAKVLDVGIAEKAWDGGPAVDPRGTPAYLAPEQARGEPPLPTADVFSLGIVLFELLTGQRPFGGRDTAEVIEAIREADPPLPRALAADIPGPVQAICLAALEKDPARRYPSAREFLLDLERFLQGESVVANPTLLADILDHGVDRHVADLARWCADRLISAREHDYFTERYSRLRHREELWVLDSRRISFSQVALHLGAWLCVVSALLMVCFQWPNLSKGARTGLPLGMFAVLLAVGGHLWTRRTRRVALVLLVAACLTWPVAAAAFFMSMKWNLAAGADDVLPGLTNVELILATGTWAALCLALWRWTRTSAFALVWGLSFLAVATALFAWMGMKRWQPDETAAWYLVPAVLLFGWAMLLDLKWRQVHFAAPLYVMSVVVLGLALTEIAREGPTTKWLGVQALAGQWGIEKLDAARQVKYSFIINGALYLAMGLLADRSGSSWWLRKIATVLFWLAPSHLLLPVRLLADQWAVLPGGWTMPEVLLPVGALAFVLASVPKQMKSFFFSGLGYLAVAAERLTAAHFQDVYAWPVGLAVAGFALAMVAWRRPALFDWSGPASAPAAGEAPAEGRPATSRTSASDRTP